MTLEVLAPEEREVVRRTMEATFRCFDFDVQARLGVSPEAMRPQLGARPTLDDVTDHPDACLAINNSLNDLLHGVGISETEAIEFSEVNRAERLRVCGKEPAGRGWTSTGVTAVPSSAIAQGLTTRCSGLAIESSEVASPSVASR